MAGEIKTPPPRKNPAPPANNGFDNEAWAENKKADAIREREQARIEAQVKADADDEASQLINRLAKRIYSDANKPQEPTPRFHLCGVGVCTPANITAISAQPKAGKTAAIGAMIASTFSDAERDCLGWTSENAKGLALVHLDTEQCPFDHWQLINRAMHRAGKSAVPNWVQSYCVTGLSLGDIHESIQLSLDIAAQKFGGIHSFILDGIADAIGDVNDPEKSNEFVSELHALAIQYHCPMIGVIHLNPGSTKTRGHLGSQLERKAETNLQLEKDEDEITIIWAEKNRRASIPRKIAPCFAWDNSRHMHVTVENPSKAKAGAKHDLKLATAREAAGRIFADGIKAALTHSELVQLVCTAESLQQSGSRRRVEVWLRDGIISKNDSGMYQLAP